MVNGKKPLLALVLVLLFLPGCVQQQEQPPVTTVTFAESTIRTTTRVASTAIPVTSTTTTQKPQVTRTTTTSSQCTIPTMQQCIDSDGSDPYKKGTVSGRLNLYLTDVSDPAHYNWSERNESCVNATAVLEYTCEVIDCNLLLINTTIDCPSNYSCRDGACVPKNDSEASIKLSRYAVKADLSLSKPVYKSGERMDITVKINSPRRMDAKVNIYGVFAKYYHMNKTQSVVLEPGPNTVSFTYTTPPCNKCAGIAEGLYVISTEVLYNDDVVARDNKNVELKQ
jgi:hypothetical protein